MPGNCLIGKSGKGVVFEKLKLNGAEKFNSGFRCVCEYCKIYTNLSTFNDVIGLGLVNGGGSYRN